MVSWTSRHMPRSAISKMLVCRHHSLKKRPCADHKDGGAAVHASQRWALGSGQRQVCNMIPKLRGSAQVRASCNPRSSACIPCERAQSPSQIPPGPRRSTQLLNSKPVKCVRTACRPLVRVSSTKGAKSNFMPAIVPAFRSTAATAERAFLLRGNHGNGRINVRDLRYVKSGTTVLVKKRTLPWSSQRTFAAPTSVRPAEVSPTLSHTSQPWPSSSFCRVVARITIVHRRIDQKRATPIRLYSD